MRVAILGAGKQARGALQFIFNQDNSIKEIGIVDRDCKLSQTLVREYREANDEAPPDLAREFALTAGAIDATSKEELVKFLKNYDVAFNALPYSLALNATKAAIEAECNMVDLGGNSDIVSQQLALSAQAAEAGVTIIPDCGLAPGLVSLLVADAMNNSNIEQMGTIKIYVGGIPANEKDSGPLHYGEFFSLEGLVNEYTQPVTVLRDGKIQTIEPLTEREEISIFDPCYTGLEAFTTSGGISTLPETYKGRVSNLEYKTLRFPGHLACLQFLKATDMLTVETFKKLLKPDLPDQVFVRVTAKGRSAEKHIIKRLYTMHIRGTPGVVTAMMKGTAYPAAITLMLLDPSNTSINPGVHKQEDVIDPRLVIDALRKAHLQINIEEHIVYDPGPYYRESQSQSIF
jgi:lysine 6-dehydrogenase